MSNVELVRTDIAEWIKSLLPPELWERYCYLSYAQMSDVPELAEYADDLREAEREWYQERRTTGVRSTAIITYQTSCGSQRLNSYNT